MARDGAPVEFDQLLVSAAVVWIGTWISLTIAYVLSIYEGHVDVCFPPLQGCASVSQAARNGSAFWVFKVTFVPVAFGFVRFWLVLQARRTNALSQAWAIVGVIGVFALAIHVISLGIDGGWARTLRRVGTVGFFASILLAEVMLLWRLWASRHEDGRREEKPGLGWVATGVGVLAGAIAINVVLAISTIGFADSGADDPLENVGEWLGVLALTFVPMCCARAVGAKREL